MDQDLTNTYTQLSSQDSGYIEIQLPILNETAKAICFEASRADLGSKPVWMPKSQMEILDMGKESGIRYFIKSWLYKNL